MSLLEMDFDLCGARPRTRAGSFFRSPEEMPSSSEKRRWPVSVMTRWIRETRGSASSSARVFCARMAPLAPVTPTVTICFSSWIIDYSTICGCIQCRNVVRASQDWGGLEATVYSNSGLGGEDMGTSGSAMGGTQPMEVVMEFIKRINAGNVDSLCELMTEDHVFQDALGKRFMGRETLRAGWESYYAQVSDYQVSRRGIFSGQEQGGGVWHRQRNEQARRKIFQRWILGNSRGVESHRARWIDCGMVRVCGIVAGVKFILAATSFSKTTPHYDRI